MECPLCGDYGVEAIRMGDANPFWSSARRAFACEECGIVFVPRTKEAMQSWEELEKIQAEARKKLFKDKEALKAAILEDAKEK